MSQQLRDIFKLDDKINAESDEDFIRKVRLIAIENGLNMYENLPRLRNLIPNGYYRIQQLEENVFSICVRSFDDILNRSEPKISLFKISEFVER